jgi:hypothetical protein
MHSRFTPHERSNIDVKANGSTPECTTAGHVGVARVGVITSLLRVGAPLLLRVGRHGPLLLGIGGHNPLLLLRIGSHDSLLLRVRRHDPLLLRVGGHHPLRAGDMFRCGWELGGPGRCENWEPEGCC